MSEKETYDEHILLVLINSSKNFTMATAHSFSIHKIQMRTQYISEEALIVCRALNFQVMKWRFMEEISRKNDLWHTTVPLILQNMNL